VTTWVLLRGLTREGRHWGSFPQLLRARIPAANVLTLDLPGNGSLNRLRSPARVGQMTESCRSQLQEMRISPPYHLLAMSLGAMVAVDWATRHASDVAACVLINTSLRPFSAFHRRLRPGNYPTLMRFALLGATDRQWEEAIFRLTSTRRELQAEVLDQWTAYRLEQPVSRRNALRQLLAAARYRSTVHAPAAGILILASAHDALVDARCSRAIAAAWNAPIAVHPTAGHDLPLDDGPRVAEQVSRWFLSHGESGPATPFTPTSPSMATRSSGDR
jgi:pimeloyl-ACP methyl ester carboxylesterase